ncbi:hypothetical protein PtB15_16B296 [Puccinia triticina]|nr:hypothetical protein PtB15_16B296 [Puccinia triticina]
MSFRSVYGYSNTAFVWDNHGKPKTKSTTETDSNPPSSPKPYDESSKSSAGQQELQQNLSQGPLPAPLFAEFAFQKSSSVPPACLRPTEAVLPTEIQEISAEEFGRLIEAAYQSAEEILALKLPRSCKVVAKELALLLTKSKQKWEESGALQDEEDIKISPSSNIVASTSKQVTLPRKSRRRKRSNKGKGLKPVDLLVKSKSNTNIDADWSQPPAAGTTLGSMASQAPSDASPSTANAATRPLAHDTTTTGPTEGWGSPLVDPSPARWPNVDESGPSDMAPQPNLPDKELALQPHGSSSSNLAPIPEEDKPAGPNPTPLFTPDDSDGTAPGTAPSQATLGTAHSNPSGTQEANHCPGRLLLTIIKSDDIQRQVVSINQHVDGTKPNWEKYQTTWNFLLSLLCNCARAANNAPPEPPTYDFQRTSCSYASWMQTISSHANQFLSYSTNKQWYCPNSLDFPLLTSFANKEKTLAPGQFIDPTSGVYHCLFLVSVASPSSTCAHRVGEPSQVNSSCETNHITRGVEALSYLDAVKNLSSSFDLPQERQDSSSQPAKRLHSVDFLHEFCKIILDVLMAYIIFQTHSLSNAPLTQAKKKRITRANQIPSPTSTHTVLNVEKNSSELSKISEDSAQSLQQYQRKQNF